jgi:hypothetical protein
MILLAVVVDVDVDVDGQEASRAAFHSMSPRLCSNSSQAQRTSTYKAADTCCNVQLALCEEAIRVQGCTSHLRDQRASVSAV